MTTTDAVYDRSRHAAARTDHYVFNQLIPYIGNKRRLLDLISGSIEHTKTHDSIAGTAPTFLDLFAGSGVVSRFAKTLGYRVIANDWEPYAERINACHVACNRPPPFNLLGGYESAISALNRLPPRVDWVTDHLAPRDDEAYDVGQDRLFYMRKNAQRIDAMRHQIECWDVAGVIDDTEKCCLVAPLLYQACYTSNTSGVFKGFHNGWGGKTGTALYRIGADLQLSLPVFLDNRMRNVVTRKDAQALTDDLSSDEIDVAYLDPPYNQHPYGSNYHVLNTIALWDKPNLSERITSGTKAAIRKDWRTERRSAYNSKKEATKAYRKVIAGLNAHFILTSYSTDGTIPLQDMLAANVERGHVTIEMQGYKRYRVSSQRSSGKPMNLEFVIVLDSHKSGHSSIDELHEAILAAEAAALDAHPEWDTN